jgi:hypothetical protein
MSTPETPPEGLLEAGTATWEAVTAANTLEPHELLLLREICRTTDALDLLQRAIDRDGVTLVWGDGVRAHPALVEARQNRITLARLLASLAIPAVEEVVRVAPRGRARGVYQMRSLP